MLDPAVMAIITGAAGNLAALLVSGQVKTVRSWIGRIFRDSDKEVESTALQAADDVSDALARGATSEADVRAYWSGIIATHLTEHPESLRNVEALANNSPVDIEVMSVEQQHNHGSGVFIGRDNHGSISTPREL